MIIYEPKPYLRKYNPNCYPNLYGYEMYGDVYINLITSPNIDLKYYRKKFWYYHDLLIVSGHSEEERMFEILKILNKGN